MTIQEKYFAKKEQVLQFFPTPGLITKYPDTIEEEFEFIQNLEYGEKGSENGNVQTRETYLLKHKEL